MITMITMIAMIAMIAVVTLNPGTKKTAGMTLVKPAVLTCLVL